MTGSQQMNASSWKALANIEDQLAAVLRESAEELSHMETLDLDQRSELYTILHTLRSETESHQKWLGRYVSHGPETLDA